MARPHTHHSMNRTFLPQPCRGASAPHALLADELRQTQTPGSPFVRFSASLYLCRDVSWIHAAWHLCSRLRDIYPACHQIYLCVCLVHQLRSSFSALTQSRAGRIDSTASLVPASARYQWSCTRDVSEGMPMGKKGERTSCNPLHGYPSRRLLRFTPQRAWKPPSHINLPRIQQGLLGITESLVLPCLQVFVVPRARPG